MGAMSERKIHWLYDGLIWSLGLISSIYITRTLLQHLDPDASAKAQAKEKAVQASQRLHSILSGQERDDDDHAYGSDEDDEDEPRGARDRPTRDVLANLSSYEQTIAMEVVSPRDLPVTFKDIGGLDNIIEELRESVIYPLTMPHLYANHSSLLTAPSGVLLFGPPGCGKTMLAKALARESGACFINLHISTLTEKWYGDSNKLVAAVFSLARKLQPTIVFIDEIDAVLGQRRSGEHEASGMVKAEFMTHWDGLASSTVGKGSQRICILGATNRIQDIDEAILRRMPKKFPVALPTAAQRRQIFELTLRETKIDRSRTQAGELLFDLTMLVKLSAGMSGSDIKEACRDAAMVPVREFLRAARATGKSMSRRRDRDELRGIQTDDFFGRRKQQQALASVDDDRGSAKSGDTEEVEEFDDVEEIPNPQRR